MKLCSKVVSLTINHCSVLIRGVAICSLTLTHRTVHTLYNQLISTASIIVYMQKRPLLCVTSFS